MACAPGRRYRQCSSWRKNPPATCAITCTDNKRARRDGSPEHVLRSIRCSCPWRFFSAARCGAGCRRIRVEGTEHVTAALARWALVHPGLLASAPAPVRETAARDAPRRRQARVLDLALGGRGDRRHAGPQGRCGGHPRILLAYGGAGVARLLSGARTRGHFPGDHPPTARAVRRGSSNTVAILLAQMSQRPMIPMAYAASRAWKIQWDRFRHPEALRTRRHRDRAAGVRGEGTRCVRARKNSGGDGSELRRALRARRNAD